MTKVYFVRHAQPEHLWEDDRTRPLTKEGREDSKIVLEFFKDKKIDTFYCSPYKRSVDTIFLVADFYEKQIVTDERFRERKKGPSGNSPGMFQKRWNDLDYHEDGGESIRMVQDRNIEALKEVLDHNIGKNIVIGTHGTALSSILKYYEPEFNCDSFLQIIDWMPYIIELDFDGYHCVGKTEHLSVEKEFKGKERADKHYIDIKFYNEVEDEKLKFAVIISKTEGKWVLCKHKDRNTLEVPGGHREVGEDILHTAKRELYEETGAIDYDIKPICIYSVTGRNEVNQAGEETFGMLYFSDIKRFEHTLHSEIEKVIISETLPENWTYPLIQPKLMEQAQRLGFI